MKLFSIELDPARTRSAGIEARDARRDISETSEKGILMEIQSSKDAFIHIIKPG